jgi:ribonuclease T2
MFKIFAAAAIAAFFSTAAFADGSCQAPAPSSIQALACAKDGKSKGKAGKFDYYALVVDWSPHHCRGKDVNAADDFQCKTNRFGFVVNTLWPVRDSGKQPQYCAGSNVPPRPAETVAANMCTIPNANAIQCDWKKQGTCTGLDDETYFATIRKLYADLHFPIEYQQPPKDDKIVTATSFYESMLAANPDLKPGDVALICEGSGSSNVVEKIAVCYDSDLKPQSCGRVPDACRSAEVKFVGLP